MECLKKKEKEGQIMQIMLVTLITTPTLNEHHFFPNYVYKMLLSNVIQTSSCQENTLTFE